MLLDLAQPAAFLLSILSLASVFHAAFLLPASTLEERLDAGLLRLALAAAIAIVAALIFREADAEGDARFNADFRAHFGAGFDGSTAHPSLFTTLPLQLFCWATSVMIVLFAVSWYIETCGM